MSTFATIASGYPAKCLSTYADTRVRAPRGNSSHTAGPSPSRLLHAEPAHGPFQRVDHDLVEGLALAEALVDPVLAAGPHGLGGDLDRESIAPDPADHLIRC